MKILLNSIFQALRQQSLFANLEKAFLCLAEIEYLGHIICVDGIHMDPKKVAIILAWPVPHNVS